MRYRIVPERSTVWIDARSSLHPIHSSTVGLEGFIELEHSEADQVRVADPPTGFLSLPVDRLSSGNPLEDRELRKRVDVKRFPTIAGEITGLQRIDDHGRYRVRGDLTFRGVTRPCEDELRLEVLDDRTVRLEGRSTFDIRDFGMQPPRILVMRVEPEVVVRIEVIAERENTP
jgi:hypothetical protein